MNKSHIAKYICAGLGLCSISAQASGLLLQEAVTANAGTASAGDGVYTDSAASSWMNPATMAFMANKLTTINVMVLDLEMDYHDKGYHGELPDYTDTGDASGNTTLPALSVFYTRALNDKWSVGLNFAGTGGSAIDYGKEWDGANHLTEADMSIAQLNPNLSYKINDNVSLGLGAQISYATLEVATTGINIDEGDDIAYGYTLGLMYQQPRWSLGLSYRSKVTHEFTDLDVTLLLDEPMPSIVGTELITPSLFDLSGRVQVTPKLTLLSSLQQHKWSQYGETPVYHEELNQMTTAPQGINRDWDDVYKYALGGEYILNNDWTVKAGVAYSTSPQDDATKQWVDMPVGKAYRYSLGAKTKWNNTNIDFFYEYADLGNVDIDRTGKAYTQIYGSFAGEIHFFGISFSF